METDLVLLDINMPGISGVTLAGRIKRRSGITPSVYLVTSDDAFDQRLAAARAGVDGFISKESFADEIKRMLKTTFAPGNFGETAGSDS